MADAEELAAGEGTVQFKGVDVGADVEECLLGDPSKLTAGPAATHFHCLTLRC